MDYVAVFNQNAGTGDADARRSSQNAGLQECLYLPTWGEQEWRTLLAETEPRAFHANEVVIQNGADDRSLYFVAAGALEVGSSYVNGLSMSSIARIPVGSVIGEQSFFDGRPRSANVWAVSDGELLKLSPEKFAQFSAQHPALARDLLFALGRVISQRMRNTMLRIRR